MIDDNVKLTSNNRADILRKLFPQYAPKSYLKSNLNKINFDSYEEELINLRFIEKKYTEIRKQEYRDSESEFDRIFADPNKTILGNVINLLTLSFIPKLIFYYFKMESKGRKINKRLNSELKLFDKKITLNEKLKKLEIDDIKIIYEELISEFESRKSINKLLKEYKAADSGFFIFLNILNHYEDTFFLDENSESKKKKYDVLVTKNKNYSLDHIHRDELYINFSREGDYLLVGNFLYNNYSDSILCDTYEDIAEYIKEEVFLEKIFSFKLDKSTINNVKSYLINSIDKEIKELSRSLLPKYIDIILEEEKVEEKKSKVEKFRKYQNFDISDL